ncbi:cuticle protein 19.8-like [Portunus trituberculatus]|uniref:cuticle protein 19.8-like n=1 Tax=Portunus trituberculatus TaxID=210409 RepID=UPI001E1CFD3E|nr:cuticle protein 19.8-like [Portunus trituberculatus]
MVHQVSAVVVAVVMVMVAAPASSFPQGYQSNEPSSPAQYSYNYGVNDEFGNNFGHGENRQGDNTDGSYSVVLPDGRTQTVEYSVSGDSGFLANVQYAGNAQFPQAQPQYSQPAAQARPQYA